MEIDYFPNNMKTKKQTLKWYQSSENQQYLSLTIKGVLYMIIPSAMRLGEMLWPALSNFDAYVIVNELSMLSAGFIILYGLVRRVYNLYIKSYM